MNNAERQRYRAAIAAEIADWEPNATPDDVWWPLVRRIPGWFDCLIDLAGAPALDETQRRVVRRVIKYLISPLDLRPEFIYGPEGFREDLALIALLVRRFSERFGASLLDRHHLDPESAYWMQVATLIEADLDTDLRSHLELLLTADAVAGDEDLVWAERCEDLVAPPARPTPGGHTIVFAGPGTGKTYRIEKELQRLLLSERVPPENILVTTFTNKAADELRLRVHASLRDAGVNSVDQIMQRLTISTIHSFCFQLVSRFHHHALFLKGTFAPMDTTQRMLFLFRHGRPLQVFPVYQDWKAARRNAGGWMPTDLFHFYAYVGEIYDFLSEDVLRGAEPELRRRYLQIIRPGGATTVDERIIATFPRYWQLVQEEGFLDHSMQLAYAEALLDDPQVRRRVQATYRHVLVDEYQDTNPIQDRIFRAVVGSDGRLFAVGDDDQSIYAFRGADVRNATQFTQRWPHARVEKLEENRRSTRKLILAATELIQHNRIREPKALRTRNPDGEPPWRVEAPEVALPEAVAELLLKMKESGAIDHWRDVAILFRGLGKNVPKYMQALRQAGVPAQISGDHRFLKQSVIRSFRAILDMIARDDPGLTSRIRKHRAWFEACGIDDRDRMAAMIDSWHKRLHAGRFQSLIDLFYTLLGDSGAIGAETLLPELGRLSAFIAEAEAQLKSPDIAKRLSWFSTYAEAAADSFEGPHEEPEDIVSVMTIHKAKGLEFSAVVIPDMNDGVMPANFPENLRTRLRRELAGLESPLDPGEEERRVLYVGMTRARAYLVVATASGNASPFLDEFAQVAAPDLIPCVTVDGYGPPRHVAPPLHAHHSAIYNYHFCPRRYLLESRYGFAGRAIAPLRAGQSLHRALEIYHRLLRDGERVTPERRERIFERAWVRPRSQRAAETERTELFKLFSDYADHWEQEAGAHHLRTVDIERPFFVAEGRGVLTGRIDLVRERDDRLEIVEFKYHKNQMMPDYPRRQLEHYALAYPGEDIGLIVRYLREGVEEEVPCRDSDPVRAELDDVFRNIAEHNFDARPRKTTCRLCPVRFACSESVVSQAA
ncbi:MAG TPA: UvrD-helicase domain-containing protein [Gammaproteobacteria bacterium]|nr:UvrD-helicase domain-containing protein [Gammaproteobacteria bacterium]